jgi:hypothetical protein
VSGACFSPLSNLSNELGLLCLLGVGELVKRSMS